MGTSAQQHRAVTGCFSARLWSSDWTPCSSGRARCSRNWRRRRRCTRVRWLSPLAPTCWWRLLLLLTCVVTTALPIILGPVVLFSAAGIAVNGLATTSQHNSDKLAVLVAGSSVTSPTVTHNLVSLLTVIVGDHILVGPKCLPCY